MDILLWRGRRAFTGRRSVFYTDFAEALEDKADPIAQLNAWHDRAAKRGDHVSAIYKTWISRLKAGKSFSEALIGTVPEMDVMILTGAERANKLPEGMRFCAQSIEAIGKMKKSLWKALAQPFFWLLLLIAMLLGFAFKFVPLLIQSSPVSKWPPLGRIFYAISQFIADGWPFLLSFAISVAALFTYSLAKWRPGRLRAFLDNHLPYSIYRDYQGAVFLVSLASLLRTGNDLKAALKILYERATPWMSAYIGRMLDRLEWKADDPAGALNTGLFGQKISDRIEDYAKRSSFVDAMSKIGLNAVEKVTEIVLEGAGLLNVVALLGIGIMFPTMLLAVFSIVLSMLDKV